MDPRGQEVLTHHTYGRWLPTSFAARLQGMILATVKRSGHIRDVSHTGHTVVGQIGAVDSQDQGNGNKS